MAPTAIENTHKNAQRVELGFAAFDADNHYYEAEDAFTRHMPREMAKRCMQWAEIDGKKRLLVGGRVNRFIPNPTFNPVSKPGALDAYFRGRVSGGDMRTLFGELDPIGNCPLGFVNRPFGIGQGDVGRSVDHVLIRKAPVVKQPTIERRESSAQSRRIVAQRLFHANSQSGEEHRSRQPLFSHKCDASIAIAVGRTNGVKFTEKGAHVAA